MPKTSDPPLHSRRRYGLAFAACVVVALLAGVGAPRAAAAPIGLGRGHGAWIFVDRQGITHVAWSTDTGVQSHLHYRRLLPGAPSFTPDVQLPVADLPAGAGRDFTGNFIVQDPSPSNRLVMIIDRCCGTPGTYALTSTNGGATWSPAAPVYEGEPAVNPVSGKVNLVADSRNGLILVQGNPDIRAVALPPALSTVVPRASSVLLSSSAANDGSVALDANEQPVFSFGDLRRTYVRRGWSGPDLLAGDYPDTITSIKIAGGAHGVVAVIAGGSAAGANWLETRRLVQTGLTAPIRLTQPGEYLHGPFYLAGDAGGRFHAVWRALGNAILYRRSDTGESWTPPATIVPAGDSSPFDVMAAAGPSGAGWALWQDAVARDAGILAAPLVVGSSSPTAPVTFTDHFAGAGQKALHAVSVAKSVNTVTIRCTWSNLGDSFAIESLTLPSGRLPAIVGKRRAPQTVSRSHGARFVQARITNVRPGRLRFRVEAQKVRRPTNVKTTVTRRK